jgi:DNA-binding PadR family transcriptional regulator
MQSMSPKPLGGLGVAVLALLDERPMHPYEISFTMRARHMDYSIKLKFGSLYHVVDGLAAAGLIEPVETSREGRRPERTVYRLTATGRAALHERLARMLSQPAPEYREYEAGLSFMHHVAPQEAARLLEQRGNRLEDEIAARRTVLAAVGQRHDRLFLIELEHSLAMLEAEREWTGRLAAEIREGRLEWPKVVGSAGGARGVLVDGGD